MRWIDYRKTLTPRYGIIWRDIGACYLLLAAGVTAVALVQRSLGESAAAAAAVPVVLWTGYWLHALFLFGHEAAHAHLAPRRRANDRLADWLVWLFFGSTTANYRHTHMAHHSHLGSHRDTETTYQLCLSVANLLKGMTGLRVLEVLLRKGRLARQTAPRRRSSKRPSGRRRGPGRRRPSRAVAGALASLRSVVLHAGILTLLVASGSFPAALAWLLGAGAIFPLCAMTRTVVEHRRLDAPCSVDFTVVEHGPVNRLFGGDPLSRSFGAAGFNKHLLHHWDPAISYTRFGEMERFLARTPLVAEIEASRIGYGAALKRLLLEARRG
ncbi:fatty acid desaturase [Streptomyces noursei]